MDAGPIPGGKTNSTSLGPVLMKCVGLLAPGFGTDVEALATPVSRFDVLLIATCTGVECKTNRITIGASMPLSMKFLRHGGSTL